MTKEIIIAVLTSSVISTLVTSVVTPHIKWGIEKNKIKLEGRRQLIKDVRFIMGHREFDKDFFRKSKTYSRIKPLLSRELNEKIQSSSIDLLIGNPNVGAGDLLRELIGRELYELEKLWELI